jgi:hypothetical protein
MGTGLRKKVVLIAFEGNREQKKFSTLVVSLELRLKKDVFRYA